MIDDGYKKFLDDNIKNNEENLTQEQIRINDEFSEKMIDISKPLLDIFMLSRNSNKGFGNFLLKGSIQSLIMTVTESFDEALEICNKVKEGIIKKETEFNKDGK